MENRLKEERDEKIKNKEEIKEEEIHKLYLNFIGLRSIKTMVAVFICMVIGYYRQSDPLNSLIAAIVCMKGSAKLGFTTGVDRFIGTMIGGLYGYFAIIFSRKLGVDLSGIIFYAITSIILIPVIYTTIYINTPESVAIAAIVFFIVTISMATAGDIEPLLFVIYRLIDTIIGIVVSVLVNGALGGSPKYEAYS